MFIQTSQTKIKRNAGLLLLCLIGIDGTIGGSIFVLLSGGIELAGAYTPLAFLLGGILALLGGLLYAEVGTTIPRPGADLAYVFTAFKLRLYPFLFSWSVLLGDLGYLAINALGFGFYLGLVIGVSPVLIALMALALAALINVRGIQNAGRTEGVTVSILLLLFIAFGVYTTGSDASFVQAVSYDDFQIAGVLAATALIFTSFVGYEYIATLSGEAKDAGKNIPLAMVITIVVSTLVFSSVAYFTLVGAPQEDLAASEAPLLTVAQYLGGPGQAIVIPAALLATGGSMIAATMITSRRLYAIAHEGFFGTFLKKVNKHKVPARAILICSLLASILVISQAINFVAYMSNTVYLIGLITIALSILRLRKTRPYLPRPFKAPFFPFVPFAIIGLAAVLLVFVDKQSMFLVGVWAVIGWFAYLLGTLDKQRWRLLGRGALIFSLLLLAAVFASSFIVLEYLLAY